MINRLRIHNVESMEHPNANQIKSAWWDKIDLIQNLTILDHCNSMSRGRTCPSWKLGNSVATPFNFETIAHCLSSIPIQHWSSLWITGRTISVDNARIDRRRVGRFGGHHWRCTSRSLLKFGTDYRVATKERLLLETWSGDRRSPEHHKISWSTVDGRTRSEHAAVWPRWLASRQRRNRAPESMEFHSD